MSTSTAAKSAPESESGWGVQNQAAGKYIDEAPSRMIFRSLWYPETTFETSVLSFVPVVNALWDVQKTLCALIPRKNDVYEKTIEGKGTGLFAARDFAVGDVILVERPSIICAISMRKSSWDMLHVVFERLPPEQQEAAKRLTSCHGEDVPWAAGIVRTNGFGFKLPVPHYPAEELQPGNQPIALPADLSQMHTCVFLTASRINHSCVSSPH
jgi:hypothetical protein